jgi:hypothetical protein
MSALAGRLTALAAVAAIVTPAAWESAGQSAASATPGRSTPRQPADGLALELAEPSFAVPPEAVWRSAYTVLGTIPDLIPPTTTTTTTTTTTAPPARRGAAPTPRPGRTTTSTAPATSRPTAAPPRVDADVRVVLYRSIDERDELAEAFAGDLPSSIDTLELPLDGALSVNGGTTTLTVEAPTTTQPNPAAALSMREPGLYPIAVELRVDGAVVAEHVTFVERLATYPRTTPPLNLAVVAAIDDPGPAPSPAELADGRRDLAAIADLASRATGPVTAVIPPVLVADLSADSELARTLAEALDGGELVSQPADELDPSSAVAIGEAETFTRELREGEDILAAALPTAPARRSAWLVTSPLSGRAAAELRNLGFRLLVLDSEIYASVDGNIGGFQDPSLGAEADIGDGFVMPALVVAPSAQLLNSDSVRAVDMTASDAAVQLLAEAVTVGRDSNLRRSLVLATPEIGIPDGDVVATFTALAAAVPDVELVPLSALPGATDTMRVRREPVTVTLPSEAGPDLTERADRIDLTRLSAESAGSMMVDETQAQEWRAELDTLLSTGLDDAAVDAILDRISSETEAVRASVAVPPPFPFTLTGRESVLRLNIRNDADEPRRVVVRARSPKLTFPEGDLEVELNPAGNTEIELPVVARSNGTSSVEVELLTPAFEQTVDGPVVLTARVNALTGLGQVITGGAVLVLLSWWFGHFRRRRRARLNGAGNGRPPAPELSPDAAEAIAGTAAARPSATPGGSVPEP